MGGEAPGDPPVDNWENSILLIDDPATVLCCFVESEKGEGLLMRSSSNRSEGGAS